MNGYVVLMVLFLNEDEFGNIRAQQYCIKSCWAQIEYNDSHHTTVGCVGLDGCDMFLLNNEHVVFMDECVVPTEVKVACCIRKGIFWLGLKSGAVVDGRDIAV